MVPSEPVSVMLNVACDEPSPQSTSTAHGESGPGSVNEPSAKDFDAPSFAFWFAGAVTVGATLATATICTDCEAASLAPSESRTWIFTLAEDGPSAKKHWKLPPEAFRLSDPGTNVPLFVAPASQSGNPASTAKVSCPGSVTENV